MKMNTKSSTITRLALLAVSNKDAAPLSMMVDRHIAKDFVIGVPASAHIAILDADGDGFREALAQWQADHPGAPAVVLCSNLSEKSHGVVHVRKPLQLLELASVLGELRSGGHKQAPMSPPARVQPLPVRAQAQARLAIPAPLPRFVDRKSELASDVLSVDICMSMDPVEVLDTLGFKTDISGNLRHPNPMGGRAQQVRVAA
jgi:hypothetical protein